MKGRTRNRNNQVQRLTRGTIMERDKITRKQHTIEESQKVSS